MYKTFKILLYSLLTIVLLSLLVFNYARYIEPNMLIENKIDINISNSVPDIQKVKIALFADTHFSDNYTPENFQKVIDTINAQKPDIVIFAGDLIDSYRNYNGDSSEISAALSSINAKYGKYGVFGNHDYGGGAENVYEGIMNAGGFSILKNDYISLDSLELAIIGIDDYLIGYGQSDIATWARSDYYNIAVSHAPDVIDEVLSDNIDIMLSGHTHGRQINIPIFDDKILPPLGRKYPKGYYTFDNHRNSALYVNSGIGTTKYPLRFLSPPEVTFIDLIYSN